MLKPLLGTLLLVATLTSCSTIPPSMPGTRIPWKEREQILTSLHSWQLQGKIAAQTTNDAGSASLDWQQRARRYKIALLGPLGSSAMLLTGQPGKIVLQTSDGKRASATTPEQLLAKNWGFNVPVSYLHYWIRGLPVPSLPANTTFDSYGRLSRVVQQGWTVDYLGYTNTNRADLPNRITISSVSLKVKIIIYSWNV